MKRLFISSLIAASLLAGIISAALAQQPAKPMIKDSTLTPMITVVALYNGPGIPMGWIDSTTRPDATEICNAMIASQSSMYANAISRSRCIIQVQK